MEISKLSPERKIYLADIFSDQSERLSAEHFQLSEQIHKSSLLNSKNDL